MIAFHSWSKPGRLRPITSTPRRCAGGGLADELEAGDKVAMLILILPLIFQWHCVVDEIADDGADVIDEIARDGGVAAAQPLRRHEPFAGTFGQRHKLRRAGWRIIEWPQR